MNIQQYEPLFRLLQFIFMEIAILLYLNREFIEWLKEKSNEKETNF